MKLVSQLLPFTGEFAQQGLAKVPEATLIRQLLERSRYGLRFAQPISRQVLTKLEELPEKTGLLQLLGLLEILDLLVADRNAALLASEGYQLAPGASETERMKRVLEYTLSNFRTEIRMEQIASVAGMAPAAFCRYFKKRTRKSFVEYLNELRISHARKLLAELDLSISQVCLEWY